MADRDTDILVSGGGIAGLIAAAAFGATGARVICVDPAAPVTDEGAEGADLRTTAFLQPSADLLARIGLWDRLAPFATPLQVMKIVDAGGVEPTARLTRAFDAADISDRPFGWNLPNWLLRREIAARLAELPGVEFRPGTATIGLTPREDAALVRLASGNGGAQTVAAQLVVAADGRNSPVREMLGIGARTIRYGQKALAFAVTHERPNDNVSTEVHRSGGPFTLVPLPDRDGRPSSAVVWMERGPEVARLRALPRTRTAPAAGLAARPRRPVGADAGPSAGRSPSSSSPQRPQPGSSPRARSSRPNPRPCPRRRRCSPTPSPAPPARTAPSSGPGPVR